VTHVVNKERATPAAIGESPARWRNAPRKATNCTTMISGPGVVSASAKPSSISPGVIQCYCSTACCAM
jgi:hypothetical protein